MTSPSTTRRSRSTCATSNHTVVMQDVVALNVLEKVIAAEPAGLPGAEHQHRHRRPGRPADARGSSTRRMSGGGPYRIVWAPGCRPARRHAATAGPSTPARIRCSCGSGCSPTPSTPRPRARYRDEVRLTRRRAGTASPTGCSGWYCATRRRRRTAAVAARRAHRRGPRARDLVRQYSLCGDPGDRARVADRGAARAGRPGRLRLRRTSGSSPAPGYGRGPRNHFPLLDAAGGTCSSPAASGSPRSCR